MKDYMNKTDQTAVISLLYASTKISENVKVETVELTGYEGCICDIIIIIFSSSVILSLTPPLSFSFPQLNFSHFRYTLKTKFDYYNEFSFAQQ